MEHSLCHPKLINTKKSKQMESKDIVSADINRIEYALQVNDPQVLLDLHINIDGKYSSLIPDIGMSCYGYSHELGFNYACLSEDSIKHNLKLFKAKLEGYSCDLPVQKMDQTSNNINVNVNNVNDINISNSFEDARQKIDNMPGLNEADSEIIKGKIDELESITNENISRKKKWEKVRPILSFIMDKSADVAITIMSLILQMRLGS